MGNQYKITGIVEYEHVKIYYLIVIFFTCIFAIVLETTNFCAASLTSANTLRKFLHRKQRGEKHAILWTCTPHHGRFKLTLEYEFKKAPSETQFKENKVLYSKKYQNSLRIPLTVTKNHMSDKI